MNKTNLRDCRSLLFLPASNPRAIEKARSLPADMLILDCEDAVKVEDKDAARAAAVGAVKGLGERMTAIRVNAVGTQWHEADIAAVGRSAADYLVLPKAESRAQIESAALAGKPVLAMIESAAGLLAAPQIGQVAAGLIVGANDLSANLGIAIEPARAGLAYSLQAILVAARAAGVAAFDGVYNALADEEGLAAQCRQGRAYGFDGKSLIHPDQIATANRIYSPDEEEIAAATRLLAAAGGGAERFEGRMIESMHVAQAKAVLAKARR